MAHTNHTLPTECSNVTEIHCQYHNLACTYDFAIHISASPSGSLCPSPFLCSLFLPYCLSLPHPFPLSLPYPLSSHHSYPPDDVLGRLYFEHAQWASYRKLVFQDLLDSKGSFKHLPPIKTPRIAKTKRSVAKITSLKGVDGDGGSHGDGSRVDVSSRAGGRAKKNNYKTCISYKVSDLSAKSSHR